MSFIEFRAGVGSRHEVIGFLRNAAGHLATALQDGLARRIAAHLFERPGDHESLACDVTRALWPLHRRPFDAARKQPLEQPAILGVVEIGADAAGDDRSHVLYALNFLDRGLRKRARVAEVLRERE